MYRQDFSIDNSKGKHNKTVCLIDITGLNYSILLTSPKR